MIIWQSALAAVLLSAAACGREGGTDRPARPERLDGEWTVEFQLEHSATLTRDRDSHPSVRGQVVLLENETVRRIAGFSGVPTHYGVYSADLRPLGLRGSGEVPTLVARLTEADSVEVAFDPEQGHPFLGIAILVGDSVTGRWWTGSGRTGGRSSGRFVMRRP